MKIAHVVRSLDPFGGGPPFMVVRLAEEMARQGHDVQVWFDWDRHQTPEAGKRIRSLIGSGGGANPVKYEFTKSLLSLEGIQIMHLHGVWDRSIAAGSRAAYRDSIPYVIAPHGMLDPWSLAQKKWKKRLALLLGYRSMLNRAAFLHLLNEDEKDLISPLGLTCDKEVIPNGIAPDEFADLPPAGTFRAAHPQIGSSPYILFLSRLHYKKGLDILQLAFEQLTSDQKDIHLVVAGPDGGAEAEFRKSIATAGLGHRVHLVGPIFGRDKLAALVDSACFCLPSRQEGFSIAILEAMACARPVVISTACHFPEVATASAGEVVPLDVAALTDALHRILTDLQRSEKMGQAGRNLVMKQYTWPGIAAQLVEAYRRHLSANDKSSGAGK